MARIAGRGKSRCGMARIRRSVPVRLVAPKAVCGKCGVVVVDMALRTGHSRVSARQGKDRSVVEGGRCPVARGVAQGAVGRESSRDMGRVGCACEVCLVTSIAGGRQRRVVVVGVALCAGHGGVCARQRESGVVVIERRICPR